MMPTEDTDDCLTFTSARASKKVRIADESDVVTNYVLKEMMQDGVEKWTKFQATRVAGGKRGRPDPSDANFKDFYSTLISFCLYAADGETPVDIKTINSWPASTINGLFDYCMTMNGLNEEGKEQAKKA